MKMTKENDPQTFAIIGAAMVVHSYLGHGFLEAVYQEALEIEFSYWKIPFEREVNIPLFYRQQKLKTFYRSDFICFDSVIVEIKALKQLGGIEKAQIINYLKATKIRIGLLLNFGGQSLEYERFINS